jgi:hypothetical protein
MAYTPIFSEITTERQLPVVQVMEIDDTTRIREARHV